MVFTLTQLSLSAFCYVNGIKQTSIPLILPSEELAVPEYTIEHIQETSLRGNYSEIRLLQLKDLFIATIPVSSFDTKYLLFSLNTSTLFIDNIDHFNSDRTTKPLDSILEPSSDETFKIDLSLFGYYYEIKDYKTVVTSALDFNSWIYTHLEKGKTQGNSRSKTIFLKTHSINADFTLLPPSYNIQQLDCLNHSTLFHIGDSDYAVMSRNTRPVFFQSLQESHTTISNYKLSCHRSHLFITTNFDISRIDNFEYLNEYLFQWGFKTVIVDTCRPEQVEVEVANAAILLCTFTEAYASLFLAGPDVLKLFLINSTLFFDEEHQTQLVVSELCMLPNAHPILGAQLFRGEDPRSAAYSSPIDFMEKFRANDSYF
jgi:hypothetical protein